MTVTEAAQNKVNQVLNGEGFLEVCLEGGGCSGYQIKLKGTSEIPPDGSRPARQLHHKNPVFLRDFGLYGIVLDKVLVEAAGIEPASASPPHTGDYMLSLSLI